jgi:hypothetical protein
MARIHRHHPSAIIACAAILTGCMIAAIVYPARADITRHPNLARVEDGRGRYVATPDGFSGRVQVALPGGMKDKLERATADGIRGQAMLAGADGVGRLPVRADLASRFLAIADGMLRIFGVLAGAE